MIFISYAHEDVDFLDRIKVHLKSLETIIEDFKLKIWDDRMIVAGSPWKEEIQAEITNCSIAILIISADFLSSEFISNEEIPQLMASERQKNTKIIPVIVGPCGFTEHPILNEFQSLNNPSDWIGRMEKFEQEEYWDKLRLAVYKHLTTKKAKQAK
jgi:hypothetical protein